MPVLDMKARYTAQWAMLVLAAAAVPTAVAQDPSEAPTARAAPAPRMPDGKPDLSGVWNKSITVNSAADVPAPYTQFGLERFNAAKNEVDPQGLCIFPGVPRIMNLPYPFQIVQLPDKVVFLYEALHNFRIVYTDGKNRYEGLPPALMGHSIGHWEGDTLIVETTGLTDRTRLDDFGNVHSAQTRVTERYRRDGRDTLVFNYTLEDPLMYAEPWTVPERRIPLAPPDWELMEYACTDNNKVVEDGLLGPGGVPQ
jgi:hypothetical protein